MYLLPMCYTILKSEWLLTRDWFQDRMRHFSGDTCTFCYTLRRFVLLPSQVNSTFLSSQNVSRCTFLPHSATR